MSDYASAAFVGLILRQMAVAGIPVPQELSPGPSPGGPPMASLDLKRQLLANACTVAGPGFVLQVGQGIHAIPSDPTLDALRRAVDATDLLDRWCRLEKYHHSHHRVRVLKAGEREMRLSHVSLRTTPPGPLENLAVLGLLAALLQAIGCSGLDIDLGHASDCVAAMREGHIVLAAQAIGTLPTAKWHIRWRDLRREDRIQPPPLQPNLPDRLYTLFDDDPVRHWPIAEAAAAMAMSSRKLQRLLQTHGASYSGILRDARVRRSARMMLETSASLAEIGYAAGFADQAHFTREFRRILGASPAEWRRVATGA
ncbi:MAG: helix-turn-helix transcriptional regulator [Ferrovibrio sp.]|uniref:helix-turn-helix transcriptional regulator n=1 Tax=Ferrovibrio sp. TaxID=1917215 RepID=UPI00391C97C9